MGMSTHIKGIRDMDGKFKEMLDIKKFCDGKKVSYPKEVCEYFDGMEEESEEVIIEEMFEVNIEKTEAVTEFSGDMQQGFIVDVSKIPKDIKEIKFYNSF